MTAGAALALASLALAAPGELRLDAGVRLEGRGRVLSPRDGPDDRAAEAVAVPRAELAWIGPDLRLGAWYAPRLRAPDLLHGADVVVLHAAELRARLHGGGPFALTAAATGERGTTDLLTEGRVTGSELQTITTTARLRYQAARGELGLEGRLAPRSTLSATAGAFVEGGDGRAAEAALPLQRGVRGGAAWTYAASRLDRLGLRLSAQGARLDGGPTSGFVTAEASWRRRLTRAVDAWIGGGATGAYVDPRGDTASRETLPAAELGIAHTPPAPPPVSEEEGAPARATPAPRIATQAVIRLSPAIDRASGEVDPQLEGVLEARWPVTPRWSLDASAAAAVVRQDPGDARRGRVEARVGWAAAPLARFGLGAYASWQRPSTPALPSFTEGGGFLSVELDAPPLR